jgi:hypothetical protein
MPCRKGTEITCIYNFSFLGAEIFYFRLVKIVTKPTRFEVTSGANMNITVSWNVTALFRRFCYFHSQGEKVREKMIRILGKEMIRAMSETTVGMTIGGASLIKARVLIQSRGRVKLPKFRQLSIFCT